jgi:uncharacterized protein YpmB
MRKNHPDKKENSWLIRIIIFLGLIALVFIILAISKETYQKKQIQKNINDLQAEADRIQGDNLHLADKLKYFEGKDSQEKEMRDKLNLQKPDEKMVVIVPGMAEKNASTNMNTSEDFPQQQQVTIKTSNLQKWWNYFFKY